MKTQAPVKVSDQTRQLIRYLATFSDMTQGEVVGHAVEEYVARQPEIIQNGLNEAKQILTSGDASIASHLLGADLDDVLRISGAST
jgi:predicted transcriptional regulator